jgi:hypothetical protein
MLRFVEAQCGAWAEQDAGGLSMVEERLAMAALDERLLLSGKDAAFFPED